MEEKKRIVKSSDDKKELEVSTKERSESPLLKEEGDSEKPQPEQIVVKEGTFWDTLAWMKLSIEEKALIAENILEEVKNTPLYWVQLVISIVIVTFGLLQNSVAVIIGGMLIAPILRPIKGIAFGITTGQSRYFWKAILMMVMSIFIAISVACLFSLITPLKIETSEILSRTSPNLLDLFIAIASGIIAILAMYFKKLSEGAAGVAMAAALLPPLAVVGIEIALQNFDAAIGSAFLFTTNLFAILAVGVIIFIFYGFAPRGDEISKKRTFRTIAVLFAMLVFISFPLFSSLKNIAEEINIQTQAFIIFEESLEQKVPGAELSNLKIEDYDDDFIDFSGKIRVSGDQEFLVGDQEVIRLELSDELEKEVSMELEVIPLIVLKGEK
ncbi:TIGR00341 family protein [Patescibacteria group bacterium]